MEGIQGNLWPAIGTLGIGGLILVLPLLWSVGRPVPFYSLGSFGDTWWVLALTSLVGLLIRIRAEQGPSNGPFGPLASG